MADSAEAVCDIPLSPTLVPLRLPPLYQKPLAREFYETESPRGGWSIRQLNRQIGSQFYERAALSRNKVKMLNAGARARP